MIASRAAVLLLTSAVAACGGIDLVGLRVSAAGGGVTTDSSSYHVVTTDASHEVTIEVSFRNPMPEQVRIPTCHSPNPPILEKRGPDGWVTAFRPIVLLCLGTPVRVAPGSEYAMTYRIYASRLPNSAPRLEVDEVAGTYRLNWTALTTASGNDLPSVARTSGSFEFVD